MSLCQVLCPFATCVEALQLENRKGIGGVTDGVIYLGILGERSNEEIGKESEIESVRKRDEKEPEAVHTHDSSLHEPSISSLLQLHGRIGQAAQKMERWVELGVYEVGAHVHGEKRVLKLVMIVPSGFAGEWTTLTTPMGFPSQYQWILLILHEDGGVP
jgi:hypothetical protein